VIENESSVNNTLHPDTNSSRERTGTTVIEFRCPQCFKLYKTSSTDIYSSQPQFECASCHALFVFDYPPKNTKSIYTRTLSLPQVSKLAKTQRVATATGTTAMMSSAIEKSAELKVCPKCQATNPRGVEECYRCGVVFSKLENGGGGGLPSLMRMWQELLSDYANVTKHLAFVDRCEEMHALPFALKKYNDLKEVQPQDSLAHQMLNSVLIKSLSRQAGQMASHPGMRWLRFVAGIPWSNLFRISPVAVSFFLVCLGLVSHNNRNLAGGGVALLVLIFGFIYFLKGSVRWRHFWH
jgi:ribosomal protein L40E